MSEHYDRYRGMEELLGTNLAEVGTDAVSRQSAVDALERAKQNIRHNIERAIGDAVCEILDEVENGIKQLPPIQPAEPEIIRCKDCLMHGVCRFEQGLGLDGYCSQAERRTDE